MSSQYTITVVPVDATIPAEVRVRRLLKQALRGYGLRCIDIREAVPAPENAPACGGAATQGIVEEMHHG